MQDLEYLARLTSFALIINKFWITKFYKCSQRRRKIWNVNFVIVNKLNSQEILKMPLKKLEGFGIFYTS